MTQRTGLGDHNSHTDRTKYREWFRLFSRQLGHNRQGRRRLFAEHLRLLRKDRPFTLPTNIISRARHLRSGRYYMADLPPAIRDRFRTCARNHNRLVAARRLRLQADKLERRAA